VRRNRARNDTACRCCVFAEFGFAKADEAVLKQRKILSVRRNKRPDAAPSEAASAVPEGSEERDAGAEEGN